MNYNKIFRMSWIYPCNITLIMTCCLLLSSDNFFPSSSRKDLATIVVCMLDLLRSSLIYPTQMQLQLLVIVSQFQSLSFITNRFLSIHIIVVKCKMLQSICFIDGFSASTSQFGSLACTYLNTILLLKFFATTPEKLTTST